MNKRKIIAIILVTILTIGSVAVIFLFPGNSGPDVSKELVGKWNRFDGSYSIQITKVNEDGSMDAAYFNPGPIKVGKAGWEVNEGTIQIYVELRDVNYPGSTYRLSLNNKTKEMSGTYYQAVTKETFEVFFERTK